MSAPNEIITDKVYLLYCKIITETCLSKNSNLLSSKDKVLLMNFMLNNCYLNIEQAVKFLIVDEFGEQYYNKFDDLDHIFEFHELSVIFDGDNFLLLNDLTNLPTSFDTPPKNKREMQLAIENLVNSRKSTQFPPPTLEEDEQEPQ